MSIPDDKRMRTCGFCAYGNRHDLCPAGTRNGNGSIHRCECGCEYSLLIRCTECGLKETPGDGQIGEDWRCIDRDACAARIEKSLASNPTIQQFRQIRAELDARAASEATEEGHPARRTPARSSGPRKVKETPSRPTSGSCRCCGEPTKGGAFLPGHDARFLAALVDAYKNTNGQDERDRTMEVVGTLSPALQAKFAKRVA